MALHRIDGSKRWRIVGCLYSLGLEDGASAEVNKLLFEVTW